MDGVNTDPPRTLDYQRLVDVTDFTLLWDTTEGGTAAEIARRVDIHDVTAMAIRRAQETAGQSRQRPSAKELVHQFTHLWGEGCMFGIVFMEQRRLTALFGPLPNHNLLGAANSIIGGWAEGPQRDREWSRRIDTATWVHVACVRSIQAVQVLGSQPPEILDEVWLLMRRVAVWKDGFATGLLFAELGGHRDD